MKLKAGTIYMDWDGRLGVLVRTYKLLSSGECWALDFEHSVMSEDFNPHFKKFLKEYCVKIGEL